MVRLIDAIPIIRELALPLAFVAIYVLLNRSLEFTGDGSASEIFGAVVAGAVGYFTAFQIRLRGFRKSVALIRSIADSAALSAGRSLYVEMVHDRMQAAQRIVDGFQHDTYSAETPEDFQGWIDAFFRLGGDRYIGVDSHPPSRYWSDYAWFLDAHRTSLRDRGRAGIARQDVRILSVSQEDLGDDFFMDATKDQYLRFVRWHTENGVELRTISPQALADIRAAHNLNATEDIALWDTFAALFTPADERPGSGVSIRLRVKGDYDNELTYDKLEAVMADVLNRSSSMGEAPPGVEMGDSGLVARWNDYLGPDLRWREEGPYRRFMQSVIPPDASVFDAAAGTGVDSVNLLANGYSVVSNEVDPRLAEAARQFALRRGVDIELRTARWEQLSLAGNPRFEAVLVLGNSLCLVPAPDRRRRALHEFFRILRPGGKLVIDERNYEYMRQHREEIVDDPLRAWSRTVPDVMYPCPDVIGFPADISTSWVSWRFYDNTPAVTNSTEIRTRALQYEPLRLYAFEHGELFAELRRAGFEVTEIYGDLERVAVSDGEELVMPSYEAIADRGFLTYVAERPR